MSARRSKGSPRVSVSVNSGLAKGWSSTVAALAGLAVASVEKSGVSLACSSLPAQVDRVSAATAARAVASTTGWRMMTVPEG